MTEQMVETVRHATTDHQQLITVAVLSSVCSWGLVEASKSALLGWRRKVGRSGSRPWWYQSIVRLMSVGFGAGCGSILCPPPLGAVAGACGGALSATIVRTVKGWIRNHGS